MFGELVSGVLKLQHSYIQLTSFDAVYLLAMLAVFSITVCIKSERTVWLDLGVHIPSTQDFSLSPLGHSLCLGVQHVVLVSSVFWTITRIQEGHSTQTDSAQTR